MNAVITLVALCEIFVLFVLNSKRAIVALGIVDGSWLFMLATLLFALSLLIFGALLWPDVRIKLLPNGLSLIAKVSILVILVFSAWASSMIVGLLRSTDL